MAATFNLTTPPSFTIANFKQKQPTNSPNFYHLPRRPLVSTQHYSWSSSSSLPSSSLTCSYKVTIDHEGESIELEVDPDENILDRALDSGIPIPHDCKLGVCMTCPAKLVSGEVDQSDGMLSDDVIERGYALLCASYPRSDCRITTIPEEELLSLQLATAND